MKLKGSFFVIIMLLAVVANAQVPRVISYQGVLTASPGGSPVNGMRNLGFALYESEDDFATPIWTETHLGVHVQHGVFAVYLGSATPFPSSVDFSKQYWLGISIDGGAELTPRFLLTASPYAMNIPSMGAEDGQVLKWNATDEKWEPASIKIEEECSTCVARSDSDSACVEWKYDGNGVIWTALDYDSLQTCSLAYVGIAKGHAGNTIDGIRRTHNNLGASSVTGLSETDSFCTVSGGKRNEALNDFATIAGGDSNIVHGQYGFIGGGLANVDSSEYSFIGGGIRNVIEEDSYNSVICGGEFNRTTHMYSFIGGGLSNLADSSYTVVAGGYNNWAENPYSAICGGRENHSEFNSFVGGGFQNSAENLYTTIAGGYQNTVYGCYTAINGGYNNFDTTAYSFIGGGRSNSIIGGSSKGYCSIAGGQNNTTSSIYSAIGGGSGNSITSDYGFIGGGTANTVGGTRYSSIAGGASNTASADQVFIGGGWNNTGDADFATIAGGSYNYIYGAFGFIGGGWNNSIATGEIYDAIAGGRNNLIDADYSFIGGGYADTILADSSVIAGGIANKIQAPVSFIGGGSNNLIAPAGTLSVIGGGLANIDSSTYSFIGGGGSNVIYSGGRYNTIAGGWKNTADGRYATVGGGRLNTASEYYSTVCGGDSNTVKSIYSTIGGGLWNTIDETGGNNVICGGRGNYIDPFDGSGGYSTIVGGSYDTLESNWSMVFGRNVRNAQDYRIQLFECDYSGQLLLNHDYDDGAISLNYVIWVGCAGETNGNGAYMSSNGAWGISSSEYLKDRYVELDGESVIRAINEMEIVGWHYKETDEYHIWPFAEEFYDAFGAGVGEPENDRTHITASDMAGVSLRAIQELSRQIEELRETNAEMSAKVDSLSSLLSE